MTPHTGSACSDLAGPDRYSTSADVADCIQYLRSAAGIFPPLSYGVATGTTFPDALTGGSLMAAFGDPLLLTDPARLSSPAAGVLAGARQTAGMVLIFGGTGAVSPAVERNVIATVGGRSVAPASVPSPAARSFVASHAMTFSTRPSSMSAAISAAATAQR